jgi:hypothetical protein
MAYRQQNLLTFVMFGRVVHTRSKLECIWKVGLADVFTDNTCDFIGAVGIPITLYA